MAPQSQSMALDVKSGKRSAYFSSLLTFVSVVSVARYLARPTSPTVVFAAGYHGAGHRYGYPYDQDP